MFKIDGTEMEAFTCNGCNVVYAMPKALYENRRKDHEAFFCPNGCKRYYAGDTNEEWLKKQVALLSEDVRCLERSRSSYKGQITKLKKRG